MNKQLDKNIILTILLILLIIYSLCRYNNILEEFIHDKKISFSIDLNSNINKIINFIKKNYFNN